MIPRRLALLGVLLLLVAWPSLAEPPKSAGLEYLQGFVGKHPADLKLWDTEPLHVRLRTLLGPRYPSFVTNMRVNGPLARYGDVVWTSGNKPHDGTRNAALFLADTKSDVIEVYLLSQGALSEHAEKGPPVRLEGGAKTVFTNLKNSARRE